MKKTLLTCLICASLLSLCSCSGNSPVQTAGSSSEAQNDNGIEQVTLKVWAEEAAFDTMNEMIESFKEAHRGEAEFNITIEQNLDSKTKDVILGDVHNGADVFPCRTISCPRWAPLEFCPLFRTRRKSAPTTLPSR